MYQVFARNVNDALLQGLMIFRSYRHSQMLREITTRGQRRLELTEPFVTTYTHPRERVLFHPVRDANPFFHLMESLWILAGRQDVAWLKYWLPSITDYSDDGMRFHGAYGWRLRGQVQAVVDRLLAEPTNTRSVLQIYNAAMDADYRGKDMPCNTTIYLLLRDDNRLHLTVCNRSNDMIWGTYGANAVQFSMLQEYIAVLCGAECGEYVQFSNNTHVYPDNEATKRCWDQITDTRSIDPYPTLQVQPFPLISDPELQRKTRYWDIELMHFMSPLQESTNYRDPFFQFVAQPLAEAYRLYRDGDLESAVIIATGCAAADWRLAAVQWLERRIERRAAKDDWVDKTGKDHFGQPHYGHGEKDA